MPYRNQRMKAFCFYCILLIKSQCYAVGAVQRTWTSAQQNFQDDAAFIFRNSLLTVKVIYLMQALHLLQTVE